jgi:DNA polymerase
MADQREQIAEHLKFFGELGVTGYRKDAVWSVRAESGEHRVADLKVSTTKNPDAGPADLKVRTTKSSDPGSADLKVRPTKNSNAGSADLKVRPTKNADAGNGTFRSADLQVGLVDHVGLDNVAQLAAIRDDIGDCVRCKLCTLGRKQIVFGVGNPKADLMFVGEAPGRDEDIQGIPFVGRAGQKLTQIIEAIGLRREDVYIANVIKCRPPENRNPDPDEVAQCEPFLFRQVDTIKPKVIVALGTFAAKSLLKSTDSISRLRGRVFEYRGAKLVPTFHPAFLLRNPSCRREVWEDMKKVRALLSGEDVA